jgi:hypothetical protein
MSLGGTLRGIAIGLGAMYLFDPVQGRRRRLRIRDQFVGWSHRTGDFFDKATRDAQHRIQGTVAEASALFRRDEAGDDVLVQRVRSRIGRCVSHPREIDVSAYEGRIVLSGRVSAAEAPRLLSAVWGVRGVQEVDNRLQMQAVETADFSGGNGRRGQLPEILQANWSPATRLFMGGLGTALMLNCLVKGNLSSKALGTLGCGLVLTSMTGCGVEHARRGGAKSRETEEFFESAGGIRSF